MLLYKNLYAHRIVQVLDVSNLILNSGCVREGMNNYFGGYKAESNGNKVYIF